MPDPMHWKAEEELGVRVRVGVSDGVDVMLEAGVGVLVPVEEMEDEAVTEHDGEAPFDSVAEGDGVTVAV